MLLLLYNSIYCHRHKEIYKLRWELLLKYRPILYYKVSCLEELLRPDRSLSITIGKE
jgi:hypothetical protein